MSMTRQELIDKAYVYAGEHTYIYEEMGEDDVVCAFISGAESRDEEIYKLEKENKELKEKLARAGEWKKNVGIWKTTFGS